MGLPVLPTHREDDGRICGAATDVTNQDDVFANTKLVSSTGDPNTHGAGNLVGNADKVYVHNILVCGDVASASADSLCPAPGGHCGPSTNAGSPDVFVGS